MTNHPDFVGDGPNGEVFVCVKDDGVTVCYHDAIYPRFPGDYKSLNVQWWTCRPDDTPGEIQDWCRRKLAENKARS